MVEESKEKQSSQQDPSGAEKKPATPTSPVARPVSEPPVPTPPRPAAAPRPATPPPAASRPIPKNSTRRTFVKALLAVGAVLSIIPFVPWGTFLSSTVRTGSASRYLAQKAVVDDLPSKYGAAAGRTVNINDLTTFPPNSHWVVTYPTSGDAGVDAQNTDTFVKYELIRLPAEAPFNGASKKATDFVAFSKVCVHLWCSPNYNPTQTKNPNENGYQAPGPKTITHQQYECPCHGSIYRIPDGLAVEGPAFSQSPPTNAIPMLTLQADPATGDLYIFYPNRDPHPGPQHGSPVNDVEADGDIGYGRDYSSYDTFLKPAAQIPADPKDAKVVVS